MHRGAQPREPSGPPHTIFNQIRDRFPKFKSKRVLKVSYPRDLRTNFSQNSRLELKVCPIEDHYGEVGGNFSREWRCDRTGSGSFIICIICPRAPHISKSKFLVILGKLVPKHLQTLVQGGALGPSISLVIHDLKIKQFQIQNPKYIVQTTNEKLPRGAS